MQDNTLAPSWSLDGTAPAAARSFTKTGQDVNSNVYKLGTFLDGTTSTEMLITMSKKDPKLQGNSNGTRRFVLTSYVRTIVPTPSGVNATPLMTLRLEGSIPVGAPIADVRGIKNLLVSIIGLPAFEKLAINQEV